MQPYMSSFDIVELNKRFEQQRIPYIVHLRDACGRQSAWLEAKKADEGGAGAAEARRCISEYFCKPGLCVHFDSASLSFWLEN